MISSTPSYGTDNACTLDALDQLGGGARGVAVVGQDVSNAELARLAARRERGLRVNFVSPQSWGQTTQDMLACLARQVASHPDCVGWHIQVFAHPEQIVALRPVLQALPVPLVIDHLGRIDPAEGVSAQAYGVLRRLLDGGNTWVELSGAYMRSTVRGTTYSDTLPLGRALAQAPPERLVWGSDWPHTTEPPGTVNDADLVDLLHAWTGLQAEAMDRHPGGQPCAAVRVRSRLKIAFRFPPRPSMSTGRVRLQRKPIPCSCYRPHRSVNWSRSPRCPTRSGALRAAHGPMPTAAALSPIHSSKARCSIPPATSM